MTPAWQAEAVRMAPTHTIRQIAEALGVSHARVHKVLTDKGAIPDAEARRYRDLNRRWPLRFRLVVLQRVADVGPVRASREFNVSRDTIASWPEYVGPRRRWPTDRLKAMYEEGLSVSELARVTGLSTASIAARLTRAGVEIQPRKAQGVGRAAHDPARAERVRQMLAAGHSVGEIMHALKVGKSTVDYHRRRMNALHHQDQRQRAG